MAGVSGAQVLSHAALQTGGDRYSSRGGEYCSLNRVGHSGKKSLAEIDEAQGKDGTGWKTIGTGSSIAGDGMGEHKCPHDPARRRVSTVVMQG